jgi:hypothetical protein
MPARAGAPAALTLGFGFLGAQIEGLTLGSRPLGEV